MMRQLVIWFVLVLAGPPVLAQRITPVHYLIASNSMLTRPEAFRQLQLGIDNEWKNVGKGLKLDLLDERMRLLREVILTKLDVQLDTIIVQANGVAPSSIAVNTAIDDITASFNGLTLSFSTKNLSLRESLDRGQTALVFLLMPLVAEAADRATEDLRGVNAPLLRQVIEAALTVAVNELRGANAASWSDEIATAFARELENSIKTGIRARGDKLGLYSQNDWGDVLKKVNRDTLAGMLREGVRNGLTQVRTTLARALDQAEVRIRALVSDFNRLLLTGNAGLSVSQSEGDLGAGLHVTYTNSSTLQIGVYVNTEFEPSATGSAKGLVGAQFRYATGRMQFDILGSAVLGSKWGLEAGLGASYNAGRSVVLGAAFFSTVNSAVVNGTSIDGWSAGLTLRGTAENSPTIVLGAGKISGQTAQPIFQVVYPIRP